jgi:RHS repeat-associated protein
MKNLLHKSLLKVAQFASVLLALACASAWAGPLDNAGIGSGASTGACDPSKSCCANNLVGGDPQPKCEGAGNPIHVLSGNKYQREVDMPALPGVMGLELVRHYNSAYSQSWSARGILGRGWRLGYEIDLHISGPKITVILGDGTPVVFVQDSANPLRYLAQDAAMGELLAQPEHVQHKHLWRTRSGHEFRFNHFGLVVNMQAPTGESVGLQHDFDGKLVQITDPQGRTLSLQYLDKKRARPDQPYAGVVSINTPVGRFNYAYGHELPIKTGVDAKSQIANLIKVVSPESGLSKSVQKTYHYEDPRHPTLLSGISVGDAVNDSVNAAHNKPQRISTWLYDKRGLGVLSVKGEPAKLQTDQSGQLLLPKRLVPGTGIEQVVFDRRVKGQVTLTNSLGQDTVYSYTRINGQNKITQVRGAPCANCAGPNLRYTYDKYGQLIETIKISTQGEPLQGQKTQRDAWGRITALSEVFYQNGQPKTEQLQTRFEYGPQNFDQPARILKPSVVAGKQSVTTISYNKMGQPLSVTQSGFSPIDDKGEPAPQGHPIERTRTLRYSTNPLNDHSVLVATEGPLQNGPNSPNSPKGTSQDSDITQIEWDKNSTYITKITQPMGLVKRYEYDTDTRPADANPTLRLVRSVDTDGVATQLRYNPQGAVTQVIRGGRQLDIDYNAQGLPVQARHNDGSSLKLQHTALTTAQTFTDGQTSHATFDTEGRVLTQSWVDEQGQVLITPSTQQHDPATGLLTSQTDPSGLVMQFSYDAHQKLSAWQIGEKSGKQSFDALGRLIKAELNGAPYTLGYNPKNEANSLSLPTGAQHQRLLDDFGRAVQIHSPERGTATAAYDTASNLTQVRDAMRVMSAQYDAGGRMVQRLHQGANGETTQITYRYQGPHLVETVDPAQTTQIEYNSAGLKTLERITLGNKKFETRTEYDALDRIQKVSLPEGATLVQRYGTQGQLEAIDYQAPANAWWRALVRQIKPEQGTAPLLTQIKTDSAHGLIGFSHGNGQTAQAQFDPAGRLTQWQSGTSNTQLGYNAQGQIDSLTRNEKNHLLGYDLWGQLTQDGTEKFKLNPTANRLGTQDDTYTYQSASDKLKSIEGKTEQRHTLNALGETETIQRPGQERTLRYGPQGELRQVSDNEKWVATYQVNHTMQRVRKKTRGQVTNYIWSNGLVSAEANEQGQIHTRYVYLGLRPVALIRYNTAQPDSPQIYAIHTDHLGTPLQLSDQQKNIVWAANYEAFGKASITPEHQKFSFDLRAPGQWEDAETGYHYNWHRTYEPQMGRYLTPDPIGLAGGVNAYAYVGGDPLDSIDPLGLETIFVINTNGHGHAGMVVGSGSNALLYDPGGSYRGTGSGNTMEGKEVNLKNYLKYQRLDGPKVRTITFDTTPEEEAQIKKNIDEQGGCIPGLCATCVGNVIRGVGRFANLPLTWTPGSLGRALDNILNPPIPSPFLPDNPWGWR